MANEKRLIDANVLVQDINADPYRTESEKSYDRCLVYRQPTVDAVEVVHGRWIVDKERLIATCSECGKILRFSDEMQIALFREEERFCYYCGSKMDEKVAGNGE